MARTMKLGEIAERIGAHLKRFEADPVINAPDRPNGVRKYFGAWARQAGSRLMVMYISYQGWQSLTKDDAIRYLAWLDAGFVGKHYAVPAHDSVRVPDAATPEGL
jgi:hypothetical protein